MLTPSKWGVPYPGVMKSWSCTSGAFMPDFVAPFSPLAKGGQRGWFRHDRSQDLPMLFLSQSFRIPRAKREESFSLSKAPASPPYPLFAVLVLRFSAAPKGPKQESPGQRPGDPIRNPIRMRIRPALKGRNKILDHKPVLPLQGVAILFSQHSIQFPGRCPGLACRRPFGARFKKRNFKVAKGGKESLARDVLPSCATKPCGSKPSLQLGQHQLFITPAVSSSAPGIDGGTRRSWGVERGTRGVGRGARG